MVDSIEILAIFIDNGDLEESVLVDSGLARNFNWGPRLPSLSSLFQFVPPLLFSFFF